jgi:hypothetical protein
VDERGESCKTIYGNFLFKLLDTTLCDKACQLLAVGQWFSPDAPVSSTNKTDRHDITEPTL